MFLVFNVRMLYTVWQEVWGEGEYIVPSVNQLIFPQYISMYQPKKKRNNYHMYMSVCPFVYVGFDEAYHWYQRANCIIPL